MDPYYVHVMSYLMSLIMLHVSVLVLGRVVQCRLNKYGVGISL